MSALAFLLGVLAWSLLEYVIHRWLGHTRRFRANAFGSEHTRHHAEGNYFAPTAKKLIVVGGIAIALGAISIALVEARRGIPFLVGLFGYYLVYEILHRRAHTHAAHGAYGRWLRRHHFHHHFMSPRHNHGVTSPIWDHVFGTYQAPHVIAVPARLAMVWLVDPATGTARAEHAADYVIVPSKRAL